VSGPRRWIGYLALVLVFAAACALLSWWQFSRNAEAQERIREVADNWDAAPVPIADLLASPAATLDRRDTWTPMTLTGTYDTAHQLLARTRPSPVNGEVGYDVLVPLILDSGEIVIIDRGWIPGSDSSADAPDSVPVAPGGEVEVVARVKTGEPGVAGRSAPSGQVATIELPLIAAHRPCRRHLHRRLRRARERVSGRGDRHADAAAAAGPRAVSQLCDPVDPVRRRGGVCAHLDLRERAPRPPDDARAARRRDPPPARAST